MTHEEYNKDHMINRYYQHVMQEVGALYRSWEDRTHEEGFEEADAALLLACTSATIYEAQRIRGYLDVIDMKLDELKKNQESLEDRSDATGKEDVCIWNRKQSSEYKRILEILEDYWLSEPDEERIAVEMHFYKADGQEQHKRITWINPRVDRSRQQRCGDE